MNTISIIVAQRTKPFCKMAGGKTQLLDELLKRIPAKYLDDLANHRSVFYEPFVGGGALFFALQPRKAFLGDGNPHLIKTYESIRDDVEGLIRQLRSPRYKNNETAYYKVRELAFMHRETVAADFIYLNKTGFNGLFRVNSDGRFNVPFGKRKSPKWFDEEILRQCALALRNTHLWSQDFEKTIFTARTGDFVYADPPYWPTSETADFRGYTKMGFGPDDQVRLRDAALRLKKKGVFVMLSNADVPPIRELYKNGFKIDRVEARRAINSVGERRGKVGELIIT